MGSSTSSSDERDVDKQSVDEIEATAAATPTPDLPAWRAITPEGFERPVPNLPWRRVALLAVALLALGVAVWEWRMRAIGLETTDLGDGKSHWAAERRRVDSGPRDQVVIIGDSRILFDTDLDLWQQITGIRPIQLALPGTNARPFLTDLADDEHFAGLVVLGISELSYFRAEVGLMADALPFVKIESPSQRLGQRIYLLLSRGFAFLDSHYALFSIIHCLPWPEREGAKGDFFGVWKMYAAGEHRQAVLWHRIETDAEQREHAQKTWIGRPFKPLAPELIASVFADSKRDIDKIRARGGDVVWIRPPSSGELRARELVAVPRDKIWDPLMVATSSYGFYFEDFPETAHLDVPEWSHVSHAAQPVFTRAYVTQLMAHVDWLKRHAAAAGASAAAP